jgi:hypothetical protein
MSERITPPIETFDGLAATPASPHPRDGGFLDHKDRNLDRITPTDPLTGVPLVLMPNAALPPVPDNEVNRIRVADWHHPFHPRASLVNKTPGLAALRMARKQWVLYERHHNEHKLGYHSLYDGPTLPESEEEQFRTVVFAAAGYIPELAIDFQKHDRHRLKRLNETRRNQLCQSGQIQIGSVMTVRDFMISYALQRDFVDINSNVVDEFLNTSKFERRIQIGNMLLRAAATQSVERINPIYRMAKREERIPPSKAHTAAQFVLASMSLAKGRRRAYQALERRLKLVA